MNEELFPFNPKVRNQIFDIWEKELKKNKKHVPTFSPPGYRLEPGFNADGSLAEVSLVIDYSQKEGIKVDLPATYENFDKWNSNTLDSGDGRTVYIAAEFNHPLTWQGRLNQWLNQL